MKLNKGYLKFEIPSMNQVAHFDVASKEEKLNRLEEKINHPNFWNDQNTALQIVNEKNELSNIVNSYFLVKSKLKDIIDTYEMIKVASRVAMDNSDLNVLCDLVDFTSKFNKIMGQVITLKGKAEQMPNEFDKFDRHIDKWGIVGLGG